MNTLIKKCSHVTKGGLTLVNTVPHDLNFRDVDGTEIVIPTSVPKGEKTGKLVVNAKLVETPVAGSDIFVTMKPTPDPAGLAVIAAIDDYAAKTGERVVIIGSQLAVSAYPGKMAGMVPVPGLERVPPAEKRMRCDKFTIA